MDYSSINELRDMSEEDAIRCEELTSALESVIEQYPFKGRPRSFRFLGAGFGCMELFCKNDVFYVFRNNGQDIDLLFEIKGTKNTFCSLIGLIYGTLKPEGFAEEEYNKLFKADGDQ